MASNQFNVVKNNLEGATYSGDLNNLVEGGVYSVTISNVTNAPPATVLNTNSSGNLMVINTPIVRHQLLFVGNNYIFMRRYIYGNWSAWAQTTLTIIT